MTDLEKLAIELIVKTTQEEYQQMISISRRVREPDFNVEKELWPIKSSTIERWGKAILSNNQQSKDNK